MNIGIIVAMNKELKLLLPLLENHQSTTVENTTFHTGTLDHHKITIMQCGIGKVNAAIGTYMMLEHNNIDLIINTGVAGGAGGRVKVMDVVAGAKVAYHDVYCGPETNPGEIQGLPKFFTAAEDIINKLPESDNLHKGLICSGDQFIDTREQLNKITSLYPDALAVDMESAAIAHTCFLKKVPFLSMRIISDSPGASQNTALQSNDFWEDAPKRSFNIIHELIKAL